MAFGHLKYAWLLLLVPGLFAFYLWAFRRKTALIARFVSPELQSRLVKGVSAGRRNFKSGLSIAAVAFTILALTQPRWGFHWEEVQSRGVDIFVAVDVSKSMLAQDVSPMLEAAKRKIIDLLSLTRGDRVGLIAFAGRAVVQCPLTLDYGAIQTLLASLGPDSISVPGTNIGEAIERSFSVGHGKDGKDGAEGAPATVPATDRQAHALVLLTDGEDLEGGAEAAASKAKERGVRIYAIGMGRQSGAPIPSGDGSGFKRDRSGEMVLTHLDEPALQHIALETGGSYVRAVIGDGDVQQIYQDIHRQIEDGALKSGRQKKFEERYQWPLFLALLCLLWEAGLGESPPAVGDSRRGMVELARRWFRPFGMAMVFLTLFAANVALGRPAPSEARAGEEAYSKGDYQAAIQHLLNAQVEDPSNAQLRYDLANAYYKAGQYDEAEKLYGGGAQSGNKEFREKELYNLGNTAYRAGKTDEAIQRYEEALKLDPNDQDAQYNLEFVKQQKSSSNNSSSSRKNRKRKTESRNSRVRASSRSSPSRTTSRRINKLKANLRRARRIRNHNPSRKKTKRKKSGNRKSKRLKRKNKRDRPRRSARVRRRRKAPR